MYIGLQTPMMKSSDSGFLTITNSCPYPYFPTQDSAHAVSCDGCDRCDGWKEDIQDRGKVLEMKRHDTVLLRDHQ